jgi:hypothetical protein
MSAGPRRSTFSQQVAAQHADGFAAAFLMFWMNK